MTDPMRVLECGCSRRVSLKANPIDDLYSDVYCRRHGITTIRETYLTEYHAWCWDCPWGKWTGQRYGAGAYAAGKHAAGRPGHRVEHRMDTHTRDGRGLARATLAAPHPPAGDTLPLEGLTDPPTRGTVEPSAGHPAPPF